MSNINELKNLVLLSSSIKKNEDGFYIMEDVYQDELNRIVTVIYPRVRVDMIFDPMIIRERWSYNFTAYPDNEKKLFNIYIEDRE